MKIAKTTISCLAVLGLITSSALLSAQESDQESAERAELRQQIQQARAEMAEAARRMARLQRQLGDGDSRLEIVRMRADEANQGDHEAPVWFGDREELALRKLPPRLGVLLGGPESDSATEVIGLTPGAGAEAAGIEQGDRLVSVNGKSVTEGAPDSIREALSGVEPGTSVPVVVERNGERQTFDVETSSVARNVRIFGLRTAPEVGEIEREIVIMHPEAPELGGISMTPMPPFPPRAPLFSALGHDSDLISNHAGLEPYFGTADGVVLLRIDPENDFGLRDGDVLLSLDGEAINRPVDLGRLLLAREAGEQLVFEVMREGVLTQIPATMPERSASLHAFPMRIEMKTERHKPNAPSTPRPL